MWLALSMYAAAMVAANLTIAAFGPAIAPINAFFLIGLDLALRDWLHVRLSRQAMGLLIVGTGLLSYLLNPAAGQIALASTVAFVAAAVVDWAVFASLGGGWMKRSVASNVAGAAVDSVVFPLLAFGGLAPEIVAGMFAAKVAGGVVWAGLLSRMHA